MPHARNTHRPRQASSVSASRPSFPSSAAARGRRKGWIDLLEFAPRGFKLDKPPVPLYRRRLTALAESIASDIEANRA